MKILKMLDVLQKFLFSIPKWKVKSHYTIVSYTDEKISGNDISPDPFEMINFCRRYNIHVQAPMNKSFGPVVSEGRTLKSFSQSRITNGGHDLYQITIKWGIFVDDLTYIICTNKLLDCSFRRIYIWNSAKKKQDQYFVLLQDEWGIFVEDFSQAEQDLPMAPIFCGCTWWMMYICIEDLVKQKQYLPMTPYFVLGTRRMRYCCTGPQSSRNNSYPWHHILC